MFYGIYSIYIKLNYMGTVAKREGGAESFLHYLWSGKILIQDLIKLRIYTLMGAGNGNPLQYSC